MQPISRSSNESKLIDSILKEAHIKEAIEFPSQEAMDAYMKEHPDADPSHHKVVEHKKEEMKSEKKKEIRKMNVVDSIMEIRENLEFSETSSVDDKIQTLSKKMLTDRHYHNLSEKDKDDIWKEIRKNLHREELETKIDEKKKEIDVKN